MRLPLGNLPACEPALNGENPELEARGSWAQVAALPRQEFATRVASTEGNVESTNGAITRHRASHAATGPEVTLAPVDSNLRVLWIHGCHPNTKLAHITQNIEGGPVSSISFQRQNPADSLVSCCVVFQTALHARNMMEKFTATTRAGAFNFFRDEVIVFGSPCADDSDVRLMGPPTMARRRLTIVRKGLFHNLPVDAFKKHIENAVGRENVEVIHVYNSGNATVVLASVQLASYVMAKVKEASKLGVYKDVEVRYSKDPCEAEIRFVTSSGARSDARQVLRPLCQ